MQGAPPLILQLEGVSKIYRSGDFSVTALEDVTLNIRGGEIVAIMGPSGSGKTTLLTIAGARDIWPRPPHSLAAQAAERRREAASSNRARARQGPGLDPGRRTHSQPRRQARTRSHGTLGPEGIGTSQGSHRRFSRQPR